jgi:adenylylsulfate kinase-like enzyme
LAQRINSIYLTFKSQQKIVRKIVDQGEFIEVHMDTPLKEWEQRDPKDLYIKVHAGEIKNFTGIDSEYEQPDAAEIVIKSTEFGIEECADQIIHYMQTNQLIFSD